MYLNPIEDFEKDWNTNARVHNFLFKIDALSKYCKPFFSYTAVILTVTKSSQHVLIYNKFSMYILIYIYIYIYVGVSLWE